ncbi:unnamed protein product [Penicillium nalgiovense]|nr:unnamed protein product [Penicillium nalgiovense]
MGGWSFFLSFPISPLHFSSIFHLFLYIPYHFHHLIHYGKSRSRCVYLHALCLDHCIINLHHYGGIGLHKSQF